MKKAAEFFKTHLYAVIWTGGYIFIMWAILRWLFGFNMFSGAHWKFIAGAHLRGFGGFVFGILILAAVPMYIATTTVILRTKKPLITIPVPKFIHQMFAPPPPPPEPEPEPIPKPQEPEITAETFPANMPHELHGAFIRARRGSLSRPTSAFDMSRMSGAIKPETSHEAPVADIPLPDDFNDTTTAVPEFVSIPQTKSSDSTDMASDFPLPTDFDGDSHIPTDSTFSDTPTFKTIDFDTPSSDTPESPTPAPQIPEYIQHGIDTVIEYLKSAGRDAAIDGEFVIADDKIIASHTDNAFWIADDVDWFATGRTRPNPVSAVTARAAELNLQPVMYIGAQNILDLDARINAWESDGIHVIFDLSELN